MQTVHQARIEQANGSGRAGVEERVLPDHKASLLAKDAELQVFICHCRHCFQSMLGCNIVPICRVCVQCLYEDYVSDRLTAWVAVWGHSVWHLSLLAQDYVRGCRPLNSN